MNWAERPSFGLRIENPEINRFALTIFRLIAGGFAKFKGLQVEGEFPQEGAYIMAANHTGTSDGLLTHVACFRTAHRVFRGTARDSILDPSIKESDAVLERTDKKGKFDFMALPVVSHVMGWDLRGIGTLGMHRGTNAVSATRNKRYLHNCNNAIRAGELLGTFIQETRVKEGDLRGIFPGVGIIARRNPDVPIIAVTILNKLWGGPKIILEQEYRPTYNELCQAAGRKLSPAEVVAEIVDVIAKNHVPEVRQKWEQVDKPSFLLQQTK